MKYLGAVNKVQRHQKMESNAKGGRGVKNQMHTRMVTFHFRGRGGSEKNGHYFPFPSDVELIYGPLGTFS